MRTKFIGLGLLVLSIFTLVLVWRYGAGACENGNELVVGVMSGYEPYARINESGEFEGFDIDVAKEIAQRLGKKLVVRDMSVAALAIALQQGKIDLLLSAFSITPETKQKMNLIYYQGEPVTAFPLVFWKKIPDGVSSIDDLAKIPDAIVSTEAGTKKMQFLRQFDFLTVKTMPAIRDIVMDVKYGKSIAMFIDPEILPVLKKQNPELVSIDIPVPEEYQCEGFGIGVNKNDVDRFNQVSSIITQMRAEGVLNRLERVWFEEYQQ